MFRRIQILALTLVLLPLLAMAQNQVTVSGNITQDTNWKSDTEYILDGVVFVTNGAKLNIEAGTVIKAQDGSNLDASALVITKEGQIFAEGTADHPIIFTSIHDTDLKGDKNQTGLWGGVVLCGSAPTNNPSPKLVEGINEIADPSSLAEYGGNDPMDNSGVIRYVSIRHTGMNIGSSSGNEIQGLTLAAVGAGTTIDHVESFASADDGFEWFGGTVNTRYLVSAFVEDDGFDTDEGFSGKNQFWFAIQDNDTGGHLAEQDGSSTDSEDSTPYAYPQIANATYIGAGNFANPGEFPGGDQDQGILLRDNTGVAYYNSIFASDYRSPFVMVEDVDGTTVDSRARLEADSINFKNSVFAPSLMNGVDFALDGLGNADYTDAMLAASVNANVVIDPQFKGISRDRDEGLDPRPENSAVMSGAMQLDGEFWTQTDYKGAFGTDNWLAGWTALSASGYTTTSTGTPIQDEGNQQQLPAKISLKQNYPNPFNPTTSINFSLPESQQVSLKVYDLMGREVSILVEGKRSAGHYSISFDASHLSSGVYVYRLTTGTQTITKKMTLLK